MIRLSNPLDLIDAWVKADDFNQRTTITRYTTLGGTSTDNSRQPQSWATEQSVPIGFTQWLSGRSYQNKNCQG